MTHHDLFHHKKKRRIWPYVLLAISILLIFGLFIAYRFTKNFIPQNFVESSFVQNAIVSKVGEDYRSIVQQAPKLLGFQEPKTYLFLFLNNTEMRPGGGFIGSYATIRIDKGKLEVLKLEGIETLDNAADRSRLLQPPAILTRELKVDKWFLRDSNWEPDFPANAERALDFYERENGVAAEDIDAVIAVTATLLEDIMLLVGAIEVQGITFDSSNVTETLQYDVHYGFEDRDINFENRKQILRPFFNELVKRLQADVFSQPQVYLSLVEKHVAEKHIMAYSPDTDLQSIIKEFGADGSIINTDNDYLMWNDANLAALKTDYAIERSLRYEGQIQADGRMLVVATMTYNHTGKFDWRTTRYRTNARLYVPSGSELVSATVINNKKQITDFTPEVSQSYGKTVFTHFHVIEPGNIESLVYSYYLPARINDTIALGNYKLNLQKQAGLPSVDITLNIDFGKPVTSADPAEPNTEWGDNFYRMNKTVVQDIQFSVGL